MTLPSFIDVASVMAMAALILMIVQYIKDSISVKLIRYVTILIGILVSFLYYYNPTSGWAGVNLVAVIASGVLAAIAADTGYNFLSPSKSPSFTLSSKSETVK